MVYDCLSLIVFYVSEILVACTQQKLRHSLISPNLKKMIQSINYDHSEQASIQGSSLPNNM